MSSEDQKRHYKIVFYCLFGLIIGGMILGLVLWIRNRGKEESFLEYYDQLLSADPMTETPGYYEGLYLSVNSRIARYAQVYECTFQREGTERYSLERRLPDYRGELIRSDGNKWYSIKNQADIRFLIRETEDQVFSVFEFISFLTKPGNDSENTSEMKYGEYSYEEVMTGIYGLTDVSQIKSISFSAETFDGSVAGKALQKEIGIKTITDRSQINTLFLMLRSMVCFGEQSLGRDDIPSYRADTICAMKNAHTDSLLNYRKLKIEFYNGTVIANLKYSASWGGFYEDNGIAYHDLCDADAEWMKQLIEL